mgnify:CR=1 FL=1
MQTNYSKAVAEEPTGEQKLFFELKYLDKAFPKQFYIKRLTQCEIWGKLVVWVCPLLLHVLDRSLLSYRNPLLRLAVIHMHGDEGCRNAGLCGIGVGN